MKAVTQSDMDSLAALANSVLPLKVDACIAEAINNNLPIPYFNPYSRFSNKGRDVDGNNTGGTIRETINLNYYFSSSSLENIILNTAIFNGNGKYTFSCPFSGTYLFEPTNEEYLTSDNWDSRNYVNYGPQYIDFYGTYSLGSRFLALMLFEAGDSITINGTSGQNVKSHLTKKTPWLYELNRIRGDLMQLYRGPLFDEQKSFAAPWSGFENYFASKEFVVSGKWVVGINNPNVYLSTYNRNFSGSNDCSGSYNSSGEYVVDLGYNANIYRNYNMLIRITNSGNAYYIVADGIVLTVPDYVFVKNTLSIFGEAGTPVEFSFKYSGNSLILIENELSYPETYITIQNLPEPFYYHSENGVVKANSGTIKITTPAWIRDPLTTNYTLGNTLINGAFALECGVYVSSFENGKNPNIFNNLEFHYAENDVSESLEIYCEQSIPIRTTRLYGYERETIGYTQLDSTVTHSIFTNINGVGKVTGNFKFEVSGSASSVGALNLTSSIGSISGVLKSVSSGGSYTYLITVELNNVQLNGNRDITFTSDNAIISYRSLTFKGVLLCFTNSASVNAEGIYPSSNIKKIICDSFSFLEFSAGSRMRLDNFNTVIGPSYGDTAYRLSLPLLNGLWIANTYPVPARNCILDSYLLPYRNEYQGIVLNQDRTDSLVPDGYTSMRRYEPVNNDDYPPSESSVDIFNNNKPVQTVYPAITMRPSRWQVLKDTDVFPYNGDYDAFYISNLQKLQDPIQEVSVGTAYFANYYINRSLGVPIKIILSVSSDGIWGWRKNQTTATFKYGTDLPYPNIKIAWASPSTYYTIGFNRLDPNSYNGQSDSYFVEITDPQIIANFFNGNDSVGLFVSAFNKDTENNSPPFYISLKVVFSNDPIIKWNTTSGTAFGFSYLNVASNQFVDFIEGSAVPKTVPPSGYTIYKLKASRKPESKIFSIAPQSGSALTVYIGQWKNNGTNAIISKNDVLTFVPFLQADGTTPMSLTIPADKSSSEEMDVFIPSFYGAEIIYQCSESVVVEAFADFQPIFFNKAFNSPPTSNFVAYYSTFIDQCFKLVDYSSWITEYEPFIRYYNQIQYPLDYSIYKDLVTILSGMNTQGAAGAGGSGGGAGGAGGAGGGSSSDI
tara:strand:+ start:21212 stop:24577 length:3366 start_codon:yes stop_codon:yes gene_type:complete